MIHGGGGDNEDFKLGGTDFHEELCGFSKVTDMPLIFHSHFTHPQKRNSGHFRLYIRWN